MPILHFSFFIVHFAGVYQIGLVYALSWVTISASGGRVTPNRTCS